jgi:hypothetical protein
MRQWARVEAVEVAMSGQYSIEAKWREGLKLKGPDWVKRELQTRVGQPDDVVLEVVYEEPYPTRDYCQQWCTEQENKMGGPSIPTVVAMLLMVIVIIAGVMFTVRNFDRPQRVQSPPSDTH